MASSSTRKTIADMIYYESSSLIGLRNCAQLYSESTRLSPKHQNIRREDAWWGVGRGPFRLLRCSRVQSERGCNGYESCASNATRTSPCGEVNKYRSWTSMRDHLDVADKMYSECVIL